MVPALARRADGFRAPRVIRRVHLRRHVARRGTASFAQPRRVPAPSTPMPTARRRPLAAQGRARSLAQSEHARAAPGEERASSKVIRAPAPGFFSRFLLSSLPPPTREAARTTGAAPPGGGSASRGTAGSVRRGNPSPANAENAFESDEDAMDERWDLFVDREISGSISPRKAPRDGERAENVDARPDGVLASAPTRRHPGWNVGVLAACAARREPRRRPRGKRKGRRETARVPRGSGSGSAERRKREPNIQTFFSPAA